MIERLSTVLALSLTGTLFRVYPRHRWLGADHTVDQVGLCEAVHGLASAAYHHMLTGKLPVSEAVAASSLETGGPPSTHPTGASAQGSQQARPPPPGPPTSAAAAADAPSLSGQPPEAAPQLEQSAAEMAQENAHRQKRVQSWLSSNPLPTLMTMRLIMEPLTRLLLTYVKRSSDAWATHQTAGAAKSVLQGAETLPPFKASALFEYLAQSAEKQFFDDLWALITSSRWHMLDKSSWTLQHQTLAMRMLCRVGCLIHQQLVVPTKKFPHRLLKVALDPEKEAARVLSLDTFSQDFLKLYPGQKLSSPESRHTLMALCQSQPTDTVQLEQSLGRVSRLLKSQSVQTHNLSLAFLNAEQMCFKHRRRATGTHSLLDEASSAARMQAKEKQGQPSSQKEHSSRAKRGGGGSWRALVNQYPKGRSGKPDFQALAQQYKQLLAEPTEEFAAITSQGEAATQHHRETGAPGFGATSRQVRRKRIAALPGVPGPSGSILPAATSLLPTSAEGNVAHCWTTPPRSAAH